MYNCGFLGLQCSVVWYVGVIVLEGLAAFNFMVVQGLCFSWTALKIEEAGSCDGLHMAVRMAGIFISKDVRTSFLTKLYIVIADLPNSTGLTRV